jgi:hypothetical protein
MKYLNVIRLRDTSDEDLPFSRKTIYKMHSQKKYPALIYSVPGLGLVLDLDELSKMREVAQKENIRISKRIHAPLAEVMTD